MVPGVPYSLLLGSADVETMKSLLTEVVRVKPGGYRDWIYRKSRFLFGAYQPSRVHFYLVRDQSIEVN